MKTLSDFPMEMLVACYKNRKQNLDHKECPYYNSVCPGDNKTWGDNKAKVVTIQARVREEIRARIKECKHDTT